MDKSLNSNFKLRDSIDVYYKELSSKKILVQFYRINTREKVMVEVDEIAKDILIILSKGSSIKEISNQLKIKENSISDFVNFLYNKGILIKDKQQRTDARFLRQAAYFQDLYPNIDPVNIQNKLSTSHITIIGVGSVGGNIAIQLARMGIYKFTLIDYKKIKENNISNHLYANQRNLGYFKTEALKKYLNRINSNINVDCINVKLNPNTNLDNLIDNKTHIVINCADEPYIGYTSVKLGRYLWQKNIPLYIPGGFDAHAMSTGEFIIPGKTPCIDCYQSFFQEKLRDWKPIYNDSPVNNNELNVRDIRVGASGNISQQALFCSSYACQNIVFYLVDNDYDYNPRRGEYLINKGIISWVDLSIERNCNVCKFRKEI